MTHESASSLPVVDFDMLSPSFFADPHAVFRRMRAEDPVHFHPLLRMWVLTRHDDILAMSRDPRFTAERTAQFSGGSVSERLRPQHEEYLRFLSHWMLFQDPPRHTVLRALMMKAFSPQVIEGMRPTIEALVGEMLDRALPEGEMDVARDLAFPLPAMVIAGVLGVPRDRMDFFKAATDDVIAVLGAGIVSDAVIERGHRGVRALHDLFSGLLEERRREPRDDLLTRLLHVEEQGTVMNEEELIAACGLLLIAGHETTSCFLGNAVLSLLRHPAELAKLQANPGLVDNAVEELLRFESPVFMMSRQATADVEMRGKAIRKGDIVMGMLPAANRDPAAFHDPDTLDIERPGVKSLSFGHGIHYCLGAALGRLEGQVALRAVVTRLRGLTLATDQLAWIPNLAVHGLASLPVRFEAVGRKSGETPGWNGPMSVRAQPASPPSFYPPPSTPAPRSVPPISVHAPPVSTPVY